MTPEIWAIIAVLGVFVAIMNGVMQSSRISKAEDLWSDRFDRFANEMVRLENRINKEGAATEKQFTEVSKDIEELSHFLKSPKPTEEPAMRSVTSARVPFSRLRSQAEAGERWKMENRYGGTAEKFDAS